MLYISYSIMGVAGYGFGVSFVSYIARAFDTGLKIGLTLWGWPFWASLG
jgi:hypothetical protein